MHHCVQRTTIYGLCISIHQNDRNESAKYEYTGTTKTWLIKFRMVNFKRAGLRDSPITSPAVDIGPSLKLTVVYRGGISSRNGDI